MFLDSRTKALIRFRVTNDLKIVTFFKTYCFFVFLVSMNQPDCFKPEKGPEDVF